MRVPSPVGAGLLLQFIAFMGCSSPVNSRDKQNSSAMDELEAATASAVDPTTEVTHAQSLATGNLGEDHAATSAERVEGDGGLNVVASDAGHNSPSNGDTNPGGDAGTALEPGRHDGGALEVDGGSSEQISDVETNIIDVSNPDAGLTEVAETIAPCIKTSGHCDPTGDCAEQTCQYESSGMSCAFTPDRVVPFTCVVAGDAPDYSPCDLDDACKPGSVCVADTFIGRDMNDTPVPRRSGTMCRPTCKTDADCPQGDFCQPATDDKNEPVVDLSVCHRYCQDPLECYEGPVSSDIRCTPRDTLLGLEESECSRKPSNLTPPLPTGDAGDEVASLAETSRDGVAKQSPEVEVLLLQAGQSDTVDGEATYCLSNWDCDAANALCVENACRVGCEGSADCSDGAECLVLDGVGVCSDPCRFDAEAGNTCSITPNCGCPDDQTCRVNDDQTTSCSSLGEQGYMDWCSSQDHCATGLSCISGLCRPICVPNVSECAAGHGECVLTIKSESLDTFTCSGNCDPVDPRSSAGGKLPCGTGAICLPSWDLETFPHALCTSENPAHTPQLMGDVCAEDFDCASGLGCDALGTCQHWCRSTDDCNVGQHCAMGASIYGSVPRFGSGSDDVLGLCQKD